MIATLRITPFSERDWRQMSLAVVAGLACALALAKALPATIDAATAIAAPLCATGNSSENRVDVIASYPLPNVAGKRVTVVRVFYGPGGFTPPHRHSGSVTAYITKGEIRSQLGGPLETFAVGQTFFEPPGSTHVVSANASASEPAELVAVFVADEGAVLTTLLDQ
jgi:quercetin dioxygenase-like cupin family protein